MSEDGLYVGREQTLVKHFVFRKYLEQLRPYQSGLVGTRAPR